MPWITKVYLIVLAFPCRTESKPELVKTEMGPPPSPASTCSDTSSIASSASLPYSMLATLLPSLLVFSGANLLTFITVAKAHNQFFPLRALICPLTLKRCSGFITISFYVSRWCFLWSDRSQLWILYCLFRCLSSLSINSWFKCNLILEKTYNLLLCLNVKWENVWGQDLR